MVNQSSQLLIVVKWGLLELSRHKLSRKMDRNPPCPLLFFYTASTKYVQNPTKTLSITSLVAVMYQKHSFEFFHTQIYQYFICTSPKLLKNVSFFPKSCSIQKCRSTPYLLSRTTQCLHQSKTCHMWCQLSDRAMRKFTIKKLKTLDWYNVHLLTKNSKILQKRVGNQLYHL